MQKSLILLASLLMPALSAADPRFITIEPGAVKVFEYYNLVTSPNEGGKPYRQETKGTVRNEVMGQVERAGKSYFRMQQTYKNVFNLPPQENFQRVAPEGVYFAMDRQGKLLEVMEMPTPAEIGKEWEIDDGMPSRRKIEAHDSMTVPAGTFNDCIKVNRTYLKPDAQKQFTTYEIYCAGVGVVQTFFEQDLGGRISRTTMALQEVSKNK